MASTTAAFQFTPLREGRHARREGEETAGYFNSRPSARGDTLLVFSPSAVFISIHAPPRGATGLRRNAPTEEANFNSRPSARGDSIPGRNSAAPIIFQFTPLREGRQDWMQKKGLTRYFNSRPSARGDDAGAAEPCFLDISIHAPPRGATAHASDPHLRQVFQFTPLREGRPRSVAHACGFFYFNSRPSARGDPARTSKRAR